ncbi:MAG: hypothetical protein EHM20_08290 [Alphaproteobacteria bacterium]|nr:MAG: hypothetical protein EHM20_08290 [Alphaproteobacteria bacterium]
MKSKLYKKFRASKYSHPTHMIKGSGNAKGKTVVGTESALQEIQQKLGRTISVHHIEKNKGQWIFCEKKGA